MSDPQPHDCADFVTGVILGAVFTALTFVSTKARCEDYVGVNTISRHFTGDHEKYNEKNWGAFYEHRTPDGVTGVQIGLYNNSYYDRTVYVVGILQPWRVGDVQLGMFMGPAWGYKENGAPSLLAGGVVTWHLTPTVALQAIVAPTVVGLQFKTPF